MSSDKDFKILKPGQQGNLLLGEDALKINLHADLRQVLSWQRGMFEFSNSSVQEVMRQIERWYDVDVIYRGNIPKVQFGGVISRKTPLSELLESFEGNGLVFSLENGKLIVAEKNNWEVD